MKDPKYYDEEYFTQGSKSIDYGPDAPYTWEHRKGIMLATVKDIQSYCLPFRTALDVGCGTGLLVRALVEAGYDARGMDVSRWAVTNVDPTVRDRVSYGDARTMDFATDSYDLVCCMDVLEHLDAETVEKTLQTLVKIAKREIIFRVPCARQLEWVSDSRPTALARASGDHSHALVAPRAFWRWAIDKTGWLLTVEARAVNLCVLPRNTYFVLRNPEYQHNGRDTDWEKEEDQ